MSGPTAGRVVWVTGLSGSGKTTLCRAIRARLSAGDPVVLLDGDVVREVFGADLGYAEADRIVHIRRMQRMARLVAVPGVTVLVSALYSNPELLRWNREHLPGYLEVYLRASVDVLSARDDKGLYGRFARGETREVVGLDIPWQEPAAPDLVVATDTFEDVDVVAARVIAALGRGREAAA